jgi:hypothetical protein
LAIGAVFEKSRVSLREALVVIGVFYGNIHLFIWKATYMYAITADYTAATVQWPVIRQGLLGGRGYAGHCGEQGCAGATGVLGHGSRLRIDGFRNTGSMDMFEIQDIAALC